MVAAAKELYLSSRLRRGDVLEIIKNSTVVTSVSWNGDSKPAIVLHSMYYSRVSLL